MNDREWYTLIENKEKEIMKKGQEAYASALHNTWQKYRVELSEDGAVSVHSDLAGDDHVTKEVRLEKAIVLFSFCFQEGQNINLSDEQIIDKAEKKSFNIDNFISLQEEQGGSLEQIIRDNLNELEPDDEKRSQLNELLAECFEEELQWDIDNYSCTEVEKKLNTCKNCFDVPEPEQKQSSPNLFLTGRSR